MTPEYIYRPGDYRLGCPGVYLLHFSQPIGNERHKARHYIGFVNDWRGLQRRLKQHQQGNGAAITRAAAALGITFALAAFWPGDRSYERKLKARKNAACLCPICRAEKAAAKARQADERGQEHFFTEIDAASGIIPF
jgi:putative endonuclease